VTVLRISEKNNSRITGALFSKARGRLKGQPRMHAK